MRAKQRRFKWRGKFWVYILKCGDNTFYTGYTPDIEKRLKLHNAGKGAKYTRGRRPVRLAWSKVYRYFKKAVLTEKRIKGLTRLQKEKLICGGLCLPESGTAKRRKA
jgi:putative endonuclease